MIEKKACFDIFHTTPRMDPVVGILNLEDSNRGIRRTRVVNLIINLIISDGHLGPLYDLPHEKPV